MGIAAYWGARTTGDLDAADLLSRLHEALSALGHPFNALYKTRDRRDEPLRIWSSDPDECLAMVRSGIHYADAPRRPIPELGYTVLFAERRPALRKAGVAFSVGSTSPGVSNFVIVDFPEGVAHDEATRGLLVRAFHAVIAIFDPDYAVITSEDLRSRFRSVDGRPVEIGWYTYASNRVVRDGEAHPELFPPARVLPQQGGEILAVDVPWLSLGVDAHRQALEAIADRIAILTTSR
jgi:hypothetical protein